MYFLLCAGRNGKKFAVIGCTRSFVTLLALQVNFVEDAHVCPQGSVRS